MIMLAFLCATSASGQVIYSNDFDSVKDWDRITGSVYLTDVALSDGMLLLNPEKKDDWFTRTNAITIDTRKNFRIETRMGVASDYSESVWYGIEFGKQLQLMLIVRSTGTGEFVFREYKKEYVKHIDYTRSSAIEVAAGKMNRLRIDKINDEYLFYINNQLVGQTSFVPFSGDQIGFKASSKAAVAVDYLQISYINRGDVPVKQSVEPVKQGANKFFEEGKVHYSDNKYDDAIISFNEVLKLEPGNTEAFVWRGWSFLNKGELNIAIKDFQAAINSDPKHAQAQHSMGYAMYSKGEFAKAIGYFRGSLSLGSQNTRNYLYLAYSLGYAGDIEKAVEATDEWIRVEPKSGEAYRARAGFYRDKRNLTSAMSDANTAVRLDGSDVWALLLRAQVFDLRGDLGAAIRDLDAAIGINSSFSSAYDMKSDILLRQGKIAEAEAAVDAYVQVEKQLYARISRIRFYFKAKMYDRAIDSITLIINNEPDGKSYFSTRADMFEEMGKYEEALADHTSNIRYSTEKVGAYYSRGSFYKNNGDFDKSLADYKMAEEVDKDRSYEYFILTNMVGLYTRMARYSDADNCFKRLKEIKPPTGISSDDKYYLPYIEAATRYFPAKDYAAALERVEKSQNTMNVDEGNQSRFTNILALKGLVLERLGRYDEATDVYNQALAINRRQPDITRSLAAISGKKSALAVGDKLPPTIELLTPAANRGLKVVADQSGKLQVIGKAKDASGIANVTINGVAVTKLEEDGLFISNITAKPGTNTITVQAVDNNKNKASRQFSFAVSEGGATQTTDVIPVVNNGDGAPVYHAILIAAAEYQDPKINDLENPVKDAEELKRILVSQYTFDEENVKVLYNKSREQILQSLVAKSSALGENDNLLIFYAGHGIAEKDKFGNVDGYWVPSSAVKDVDATYISADDIRKSLKRSNAKHVLVVADACFSGALTRELSSEASVAIQRQYSIPSRKIMASGNLEPVPDDSRFIYYLKRNLKDNKQKYLTARKLFDSFYEAVMNNSETTPQYSAIKNVGDEGGEFVFIKRN